MRHPGKVGFMQSYTYLTWKTSRWELPEYVSELASDHEAEYVRPNVFVVTPHSWNAPSSMAGRRPSCPGWCWRGLGGDGIYSGHEHFENVPVREGSEEP
jgi:starch synthase (maltosyl-transferring)